MEISRKDIQLLTDSRSWNRGVGYYEDGSVISIFEDKDKITAKVRGSEVYVVELVNLKNGSLRGKCSCPMEDSGVFCKHCVAVALTYIEGPAQHDDKTEDDYDDGDYDENH